MTLGEFIKKLRIEKGLSQRQLSELAKVSNTEISRIESGERRNPSPSILRAISPHLGADYSELMACAGYMEERIDHEKYTELVWRDSKGEFADTLRMAKNICHKDSDLIRIMNIALDKLPPEDMDIIKGMLNSFASDNITEDERTTLRTIIKYISKNR